MKIFHFIFLWLSFFTLLHSCSCISVINTTDAIYYSVFYNNGKWSVQPGKDLKNCVAYGYFSDEINTTGWSFLWIQTKSQFPDNIQAFGAGYLEGSLTYQRISHQ